MANVMTRVASNKTDVRQKQNIVFRSYIRMKDGEVEFIEPEKMVRPKCGEIWKCNLGDTIGSVQGGFRPVFVFSNNKNNMYSSTVNVFPLTTKMNKRQLPVHVELWDYKRYGLSAPSTVLVEQPMTIPVNSLTKKIGEIDDTEVLYSICVAMGIQFPILTMGVQN